MRWSMFVAFLLLATGGPWAAVEAPPFRFTRTVEHCKITLLSTALSRRGVVGEWGFSALVEADGESLLFDTGAGPEAVLQNAQYMGLDLRQVRRIVLSHGHNDHTGGLLPVLRFIAPQGAQGVPIYAHPAVFMERYVSPPGSTLVAGEEIGLPYKRATIESLGGRFVFNTGFTEIAPGIALTGQIPRVNGFEKPSLGFVVRDAVGAPSLDLFEDDQSLVINTRSGLVLVSGCGHAGIVNILDAVRQRLPGARLHAVLGGFHIQFSPDPVVDEVARKFAAYGVQNVVGAHCTGIEPIFRFRAAMQLDQRQVFVGSVGTAFSVE